MRVAIVDGNYEYDHMWVKHGHTVVDVVDKDIDIVQFTGGSDVTPMLYGEEVNRYTNYDMCRDLEEVYLFNKFLHSGIPMVGICRGAQFLNVMSGGKMWQHVDNHCEDHYVDHLDMGERYLCSSTHHQMMRPSLQAEIVGVASPARTTAKMGAADYNHCVSTINIDVEVLWYEHTKCLCFQPHPEYRGYEECEEFYFNLLNRYLGVVGE
jgi:gamma-glutamyl-gamma-aminobutyrate hydrolase PuuD